MYARRSDVVCAEAKHLRAEARAELREMYARRREMYARRSELYAPRRNMSARVKTINRSKRGSGERTETVSDP